VALAKTLKFGENSIDILNPMSTIFTIQWKKTIAGKGLEMVAHDSSSSNFFVKLGKKHLI
jgi:hypothetical protein